jgi:hypothetical protein
MSKKEEIAEEVKNPLDVAKVKNWYKEQISMAKLRTELAELMSREAKAGAERLHFLGSIASMQGNQPVPSDEGDNGQDNGDKEVSSEEPASTEEAVVRSIN